MQVSKRGEKGTLYFMRQGVNSLLNVLYQSMESLCSCVERSFNLVVCALNVTLRGCLLCGLRIDTKLWLPESIVKGPKANSPWERPWEGACLEKSIQRVRVCRDLPGRHGVGQDSEEVLFMVLCMHDHSAQQGPLSTIQGGTSRVDGDTALMIERKNSSFYYGSKLQQGRRKANPFSPFREGRPDILCDGINRKETQQIKIAPAALCR